MAELSESNSSTKIVQVEEQVEGETIETNDYFFCEVGKALSVMSDGSNYDTENPPSKPLVISRRFGLVFVAHSKGFCVAKMKDVVAAANKGKDEGSGCSVQELSVVDVHIGRVSILALSLDSSLVAAVVGGEIQFFSVDSLLNKDKAPTFSCCVESNRVKDILWVKEIEPSFICVTDSAKLLLGAINKPLKHVMDEVDAVGTRMDGSFIAVARRNKLSILSPKFKEILHISLPIDNWVGDSNNIKVDSIRWVRSDSIVVGCFQKSEDGSEENYFIQVITSKDGQIIDDSSKLVSVDFNDIFTGIVDNIVPCGSGPYLFVNYLENCELAFLSNRKNTDEHIMLFNWSQEDNQVSLVYIDRDKWLPRIQLQENGDDNSIFGLGVDESLVYENVKVHVGVEERELPPHCVLVCLTLEGKLVMFYVASISGLHRQFAASSDAQNTSEVGPSILEKSLQLEEESAKQSPVNLGLHDSGAKEISSALDEVPTRNDHNSAEKINYTIGPHNSDQNIRKELDIGMNNQRAVVDVSSSKPFGLFGQSQEVKSNQFSFSGAGDIATEKLKIGGGVPLTDKPVEKNLTSTVLGVEEKTGSRVLNITSTTTTSGNYSGSSGVSSEKPLFSSPNFAKNTFSPSPLASTEKLNSSGSLFRNFGSRPSDTSSSAGQAMNHSQKLISGSDVPGSLFNIPSLKAPLQEVGKLQNITNQSTHLMPGNDRMSSPLRQGYTDHNFSKQFSNVHNMAKELDKLLESIEEVGGFREACTTAHRNSLQALEEAIDSLSERNRVWQSWTEERLREIQLLLDKTVQVLARKTHMEGIVRQASDEQYWELWNRQKLSSELDQKRNKLLNQNQDLINQMIELEKHFNTLELNLFGETSGVNLVSRVLNSRSALSRHSHSLHAIHNAAVSQLAAAKQLSDSLSKQMAVLSIKSPPTKQMNVKKQVFDSIGIPYPDDSIHSPNPAKVMDSPSNRLPLLTCSSEGRNGTRRIHLSGVSSHDHETARRRRDSLDRNWANFEAPKTTVKRMTLQNEHPKFGGLFSSNKESASPGKSDVSMATYSKVLPMQDKKDRKDMPQKLNYDTDSTSNFKWAGGIPELSQAETEHTSRWKVFQRENFSTSTSSLSSSSLSLSTLVDPNTKKDDNVSTPERTGTRIVNISKFDNSGTTSLVTKPSVSQSDEGKSTIQKIQPSVFSFSNTSGQAPTFGIKATETTKPIVGLNFRDVSANKKYVESSTSSVNLPVSSASWPNPNIQTLPLTSIENGSTTSTKMAKDVNKDALQFSSSPFSVSSSLAASVSSVSSKVTEMLHTDSSGSSLNLAKEPIKTAPQAESNKVSVENNVATTPQSPEKLPLLSSSGLNFGQMTSFSPPTEEIPKTFVSSSDLKKTVTQVSAMVSNTPEKESTAVSSSPASPIEFGGPSAGKSNIEATIAGEDEMDEEAPETNQTSLGNFGGFGLGSTPSSTAPKSNPFGGPITSAPQNVASSVSLTVPSGELFRPASFSFPSMQPSQPSQSTNIGAPSGAFAFTNAQQSSPGSSFGQPSQFGFQQKSPGSGFGQPSQIGSQQSSPGSGFVQPSQIGSGQQALGSVLGSFGQSRQLGTSLPGSSFGVPQSLGGGGFGRGFATTASSGGGFAAAAATGGFAAASSTVSGFAAAAPRAGGFASAVPGGGGFAAAAQGGGGFAATAGAAGGFGAFNKTGGSGFSVYSGSAGGQAPPTMFTQMRK